MNARARVALSPELWDLLMTTRGELAVAVANALTRVMEADRHGRGTDAALRLYQALDDALHAVNRIR